jgi:hypothetical protein
MPGESEHAARMRRQPHRRLRLVVFGAALGVHDYRLRLTRTDTAREALARINQRKQRRQMLQRTRVAHPGAERLASLGRVGRFVSTSSSRGCLAEARRDAG